jgi:hypothetical protein
MITNGFRHIGKTTTEKKTAELICSVILEIKLLIFKKNKDLRIQNISTKGVIINKTHWFVRISRTIKESEYFNTKGKLKINSALAGVGKPMNEFV